MSALAELYTIPQEHLDFRDTIRQIARERIAPRAAQIDEQAEYPTDLRELLAEQDVLGLPFDTEYGGTGTGALMLNMAVEEIAKACASTALILMVQELGTLPIKLFGSEELKQRFLPRCATGEWSPAFALSEPDAGSDPGGMRTRAIRNGDESQLKTVRITLKSEDHAQTVATWVLKRARIIKYVSGPFNAKGTDVAMEELTLSYERLEVEDVA